MQQTEEKVTGLKPEIKTLWIEALRSGEYKQCRYKLHGINSYCCLGVLCDLYLKQNNDTWGAIVDAGYAACQGAIGYPPKSVCDWSGLFRYSKLSLMNDSEKASFAKIADYIEKNL